MRAFHNRVSLLLLTMIMDATAVWASETGPVSQAWAVRIDGPTGPSLEVSGMDVGPSGDVFLVGAFRSGGPYLSDIMITRRSSSSGAAVWQRSYEPPEGPSASESAVGLVAHGTNIYVAGTITTTNGRVDFLTLKYRDTGELEWAVRRESQSSYGYGPTDIAVDSEGNVLVLGLDMIVLKYGRNGSLLWTYTYSYDGPVRAVEMRVDAAGNIHVAGELGPHGGSSVVTFKLDPDGHELWTAVETSGSSSGVAEHGLDIDSAGNVVTVGREGYYSVIWKYDANGNRQWTSRYRSEDTAYVNAKGVRIDGSGNSIVAARVGSDALLIKYAADGQELWASRIRDPNGPAYLAVLDLDSAGNSYLVTSPNDLATVKVNPDGAQLWFVTYNSQGVASDYGDFLEVMPSGDIFVAGRSYDYADRFGSLAKYTQQPVSGVATVVVTPALQVVDPGTNVVFTAETIGPGPIDFQWRKNARLIPDATNSTLALSNVQAADRGDYSVLISNSAGATVSPEARLSVRVAPEVTIAPTETLAYLGTDAAFVAAVAGNDFATFQWRHNGTNIPGATNEVLRLVNANAAMAGSYDTVVTTFGGSITSSAAGLTISRALELVGTTPYRSFIWSWEYAPLLRVLPNGESLLAGGSNQCIVLQKHAANGELLWTTTFESAEFANAAPTHLVLDVAGNIFIAGVSRPPNLPTASAVLKYDPDGQLLWSRFLAGTNPHDFAVDPEGNSGIAFLGPGRSVTVTRYNHAGDLQWSHFDPSPDYDTVALAADASGNTYLGTTTVVGGYNQVRLRQLNSAGAIVWTVDYGQHSRLGEITVDPAGHLIVAGIGQPPPGSDGVMFVQKYSSAGQKLWEIRTGSSWSEITGIYALAVGPGSEITVLHKSDDDYPLGEESGLTRIGPDGQLRFRIKEPQILVWSSSHLALDTFGNAYITGWGWGGQHATGLDATTAKYDAYGHRHWLVYYHNAPMDSWQYSVAVGADAAGDIRVLVMEETQSNQSSEFSLLHYRQRDPAGTYRLQLVPDPGGTFHLTTPTQDPFRIEASADLQTWDLLSEQETQKLLQPGATAFANYPKRFFRLVLTE